MQLTAKSGQLSLLKSLNASGPAPWQVVIVDWANVGGVPPSERYIVSSKESHCTIIVRIRYT